MILSTDRGVPPPVPAEGFFSIKIWLRRSVKAAGYKKKGVLVMASWDKFGLLAGGVLLGSYGIRILTSRDAKKVYTHTAAAVLRMKDEVMKDVEMIRENAEDIHEAAKDINEKRREEYEARMIEDAKAVLADTAGAEV